MTLESVANHLQARPTVAERGLAANTLSTDADLINRTPLANEPKEQTAMSLTDIDKTVVVITALRLEQDAMLRHLEGVVELILHNRRYFKGQIGGRYVLVHCLNAMGGIAASALTSQIIAGCSPTAIILVGIAGGKKKNDQWSRMLGDVLVADQLIDVESGTQTEHGLEHRPQVYRATPRWINAAHSLKNDEWLPHIAVNRPDGSTGRVVPRVHVGPIASTQAVIKHGSHLEGVSSFFTNLLGVEMEGVGAAMAALNRDDPVDFVLIKSICDWADAGKDDAWQPYAADAAAAFATALIHKMQGAETKAALPRSQPTLPIGEWKNILSQRLHTSWEELADTLSIPTHEKRKFEKGEEARRIVEWLEARDRQGELLSALLAIGRADLVKALSANP